MQNHYFRISKRMGWLEKRISYGIIHENDWIVWVSCPVIDLRGKDKKLHGITLEGDILIFGIFFLAFVLAGFMIFDILLRKEYRENYDLWERDGKPFGVFWVPRESRGFFLPRFRCQISRGRILSSWLFSTPLWMKYDKKALLLIRMYRILSIGAILSWIAALLNMIMKG